MLDETERVGDECADQLSQIEQDRVTAELAAVAHRRAIIDQAKGMLMLVFGFDEDAAFASLRSRSQDYNVKLRDLATQLVSDFRAMAELSEMATREDYVEVFMTVQDRVPPAQGQPGQDGTRK